MKMPQNLKGRMISTLACAILFACTVSAQESPELTDPEIASVAVTANQIDVNYGKFALKKSKNAEVRRFAKSMIQDHNSIIKQAVDLAGKLGRSEEHTSELQ